MKMGKWFRVLSIPFMAAVLFAAGCTDQSSSPLSPEAANFAKGGGNSWKPASGPSATGIAADGSTKTWRVGVGKKPNQKDTKGQAVFGAEGGYIFSQGHVLYVPRGAVSEPTIFKITPYASMNTEEAPVAVSLKAYRILADGTTLDVGAAGFNVPVYLGLSYGWAYETNQLGLGEATVIWLKQPGVAEEVQARTFDYDDKWLVAELHHFSDYGLAWPGRCTDCL
jgi:hypothetical protein